MKKAVTRICAREPQRDQIEAAYLLVAQMKGGTEARDKALVAEVWRVMFDAVPYRRTGLTTPQRQVLEAIADYIDDHKVSPTYEEIGQQFGRDRRWAHYICTQLARRKIVSIGGGWRELRILKNPNIV